MRVPQPTPPDGGVRSGRGSPAPSHPRRVRIVRGGNGFGDHLVGLVDGALDAGGDDGLAREPALVLHADVGGEDDGVGVGDRLGGPAGVLPDEPCVSTMHCDAGLLGRGGQRVGGHVGVRDAGRAGGDRDDRLGGLGLRRSGSGRRRASAAAAGAGLTTPSTRSTTSSAVDALRSDSTKSLRTSARARLDSSFMCSAPPDSGAAIRNARSAGPSGAPKSTAGFSRANPIDRGVDVRRTAVRDRDAAGQPGGRLFLARHGGGDQARRRRWCVRRRRGRPTSRPITACLSPPTSTSSSTRSVVMIGGEVVERVMAILSSVVVTGWRESARSVIPERH